MEYIPDTVFIGDSGVKLLPAKEKRQIKAPEDSDKDREDLKKKISTFTQSI
jgi:hypothetical protein